MFRQKLFNISWLFSISHHYSLLELVKKSLLLCSLEFLRLKFEYHQPKADAKRHSSIVFTSIYYLQIHARIVVIMAALSSSITLLTNYT
jgi:hypothetical protein